MGGIPDGPGIFPDEMNEDSYGQGDKNFLT
jgi:hypothetical protein